MTVSGAIRAAAERLAQTSDTARLDAELLMAHALGVSRSDLLLKHMGDEVPAKFDALVERRAGHEPVAHITGRQEFFGLDFRVTPDTLIPRGDSETIVEAALDKTGDAGRVLDMGTGTGALLLAFLSERPGWSGVGIDASAAAVEIAAENAATLDLPNECAFHRRSWNNAGWSDDLGRFDLILCNPPYVEDQAALDPDVRDFEPHSALFAGPQGLDDYRIVIPQLPALLQPEGVAVLEIGHKQGVPVREIAASCGFASEIRRDLGQRDRALILTRGVGKAGESV